MLESKCQLSVCLCIHLSIVLKVRVNGLYKTGNVTGFQESVKDPLKQVRKDSSCARKLYQHAITYYRIQLCSTLA